MRLRRILWTLAAAVFLLPALAGADVITYEREELPGGGVLLVKQSRQLPMVRIAVSIPAGARHEAPERAGLANLTSAMITRGTKTRSASDIEKTNDSLGGGVGVEVGRARAEASMRVLTRDLEEGLSLLGDVLRNPVFPAEEIGKTKKRIVGGMRRQRERPGHLANKALRKSLFGETPYGRLVEGTEESIKNLGREDLVRFHRKWYGMKGSIFVFVGDVSLKRARELVLARFKGWQAEGGKIPEPAPPEMPKKMQVVKIDRPLSQSTVILGNRSLKRTHPDFYAARVMNYILGRGRVFQQDHGQPERRKGPRLQRLQLFRRRASRGPLAAHPPDEKQDRERGHQGSDRGGEAHQGKRGERQGASRRQGFHYRELRHALRLIEPHRKLHSRGGDSGLLPRICG